MGACVWNPYWEYITRRDPKTRELKLVRDQPRVDLKTSGEHPLRSFSQLDEPSGGISVPDRSDPDVLVATLRIVWSGRIPRGGYGRKSMPPRQWGMLRMTPRASLDFFLASIRPARAGWCRITTSAGSTGTFTGGVGSTGSGTTIRSEHRLTDPAPLTETEFHGKRPYVMGLWLLETPQGPAVLSPDSRQPSGG